MYKLCRFIAGFLLWLGFGVEVKGLNNIPSRGPAVIAANHVSLLDPVAVAVGVKRQISFMAKTELFGTRFTNWFFHSIRAFPVKRGLADRSAIRSGLGLLAQGHLVGIFPEGTRSKDRDEQLPIQSGAALFSIRGQVPIIPVVVKGTKPLCFRKRIFVIIGEPILPPESKRATKEELISVNNTILQQFTHLGMQEFA